MSVQQIIEAIPKMSSEEMDEITAALAQARAERDAQLWDEQIESDILAGKLDFLIEEAEAEMRAGTTRPR